MATQKTSRLTDAILETADGLHRVGIMDDATYDKITLRLLGKPAKTAEPITGEQIRQVPEQAKLNQAVFACYLNVTTGYVSQLKRGTKQPKNAALALLNFIRLRGIKVVLGDQLFARYRAFIKHSSICGLTLAIKSSLFTQKFCEIRDHR